jgi:hypothetical protein
MVRRQLEDAELLAEEVNNRNNFSNIAEIKN